MRLVKEGVGGKSEFFDEGVNKMLLMEENELLSGCRGKERRKEYEGRNGGDMLRK